MDRTRTELNRQKFDREAIGEVVEALLNELEPYVRFSHEEGGSVSIREVGRNKEVFTILNHTTGLSKEIVGWDDLAAYVGLSKATLAVYFSRESSSQTKGLAIERQIRGDHCTIIRKTKAEILKSKGVDLSSIEPSIEKIEPKKSVKYRTPYPKGHGAEE
jgi:hypothetical protein